MPPEASRDFFSLSLAEQLADLERIRELEDDILRNLLITQRYHDLSHLLARVVGGADANWSTFATWASSTAGQSIREEDVPPEFAEFLRDEARLEERFRDLVARLGPVGRLLPDVDVFELARAILRKVSEEIALGNRKVYAELSPLFARFAAEFSDPDAHTAERVAAFNSQHLTPGEPNVGGQDKLAEAFQSYVAATVESEPHLRAQRILYGNVLIGFHEQTRLQSHIAGALDAPFSVDVYRRFGAFGPRLLHPAFTWVIAKLVGWLSAEFLDDWQRLATRFLMKLSAPNGQVIPLGRDPQVAAFDPLLRDITLPELRAFLSRYDADLSTPVGAGAANWTLLGDRMRFIGELFRIKQRRPAWFEQPFSDEVRNEIEAGRRPDEFAPRVHVLEADAREDTPAAAPHEAAAAPHEAAAAPHAS